MLNRQTYRDVLGLRVVRHFRDEQVSPDHRNQILEAARWTGSSKNTQNWAFVSVTDPEIKESLAACGSYMMPVRNAPWAIVLVSPPVGYEFDIGRAAQNIMLAAASLGVASCPVTLHDEESARAVLEVPADHRCRYAIALGYPDEEAERAAREGRAIPGGRKPRDELVHENRFRSS